MTDIGLFFEPSDIEVELIPAGFYPSTIARARLRKSASGHPMLHVVHALDGVAASCSRLADYFIVDGASAYVLALTRRRLVQLYRACGQEPIVGERIEPKDLVDSSIDIRVEHDRFKGQPRLRVVEYRPRTICLDGDIPF